jgi:hypothetical protein
MSLLFIGNIRELSRTPDGISLLQGMFVIVGRYLRAKQGSTEYNSTYYHPLLGRLGADVSTKR